MRYAILLAALLIGGCARYDYPPQTGGGHTIRVDRVSGETQVLTAQGWKPLVRQAYVPQPVKAAVKCPGEASGPYADLVADLPCPTAQNASPRRD